jgi:hypothetical protein
LPENDFFHQMELISDLLMSNSFHIMADNGRRLELRDGGENLYTAALVTQALSANVDIYHGHGDGIEQYFAEVADAWRGWQGERRWESLEGQLSVAGRAPRR